MPDPRRWIDLHMHSTASDGVHPPSELMRLCAQRNLSAVALTDHDTIAGLAEAAAAAKEEGVELIPGVELAARLGPYSVHLLGYFFDPANTALLAALEQIRQWRRERNNAILERLAHLGIVLDFPSVANADHSLGRPHFAHALVRAGHATDLPNAFTCFLARGGRAYVPRQTLSPADAIAAVRNAGGIVSLAHPCQVRTASTLELETLVGRLRDLGLQAIEVHHTEHTATQTRAYLDIARRLGLAMTGGSDYHGRPGARPPQQGVGFSRVRVPLDLLPPLREIAVNRVPVESI